MRRFDPIFLALGFSILLTGCSSYLLRQGYRLDSASSRQVKQLCSGDSKTYKGAEIDSADTGIQINFENRERSSFMGPPLIPFIPIGLGEDKNIVIYVTTKNSSEELKTDFNFWQFSPDGKHWSFPLQIDPVFVYSDGASIVPREEGSSSQNRKFSGTQITSRFDMNEAEIVFIKTADMTVGSRKIPSLILKWTREDYSRYTPMIAGMDGEAKSMMLCR